MLTQVVQAIGWKHSDDRDTIIGKADLQESIVKLQRMGNELKTVKGNVGKYVKDKGITTVHDVLVVLRRLARSNGHAIVYRRASNLQIQGISMAAIGLGS